MSTSSTAPPSHVLTARSLEEISEAVRALQDWNTLEAIPHLARYDRKTKGWLFILTSWLVTSAAAITLMACLLAFLTGVWTIGLMVLVALANGMRAGWGGWTALIAAVIAMLVLFRDERFTELTNRRLRYTSRDLPWPLRFGLWCSKMLIYLMIAMVAGGVLAIALSPLILASLDYGLRLSEQLKHLGAIIIYVKENWPGIFTVTTVMFFAVLGVRSVRKAWVTALNAILIGGWGLMQIFRISNELWHIQRGVTISVILMAALVYGTRLAFVLVRPFALPLAWLHASANLLTRRVRLRVLLAQAIHTHRRRSTEAVGGDWRTAVCTECLARFEQRSVLLSYGRRLRYAWCRNCHSDLHCFAGVRRIEGRLERGMTAMQEQVKDVLRIDLLTRLEPNTPNMPMDLDEITIAGTDDEDVEGFIVAYKEEESGRGSITPLRHLNCRIEPTASVSEIILRNLKETFRHIEIPE